jgi:hypothetical protein
MPVVARRKQRFTLDDNVDIPENMGFMVTEDCTLSYLLRDSDDNVVADTIVAGIFYPFDIRRARSTGTTPGTAEVTVFYPKLLRDFAAPRLPSGTRS